MNFANTSHTMNNMDWDGIRHKAGRGLNRFLKADLHRSVTDKYFAGVLGGIAETYGINSTLVRLLFLASFFLPGPQAILYFIMWFVMPKGVQGYSSLDTMADYPRNGSAF